MRPPVADNVFTCEWCGSIEVCCRCRQCSTNRFWFRGCASCNEQIGMRIAALGAFEKVDGWADGDAGARLDYRIVRAMVDEAKAFPLLTRQQWKWAEAAVERARAKAPEREKAEQRALFA